MTRRLRRPWPLGALVATAVVLLGGCGGGGASTTGKSGAALRHQAAVAAKIHRAERLRWLRQQQFEEAELVSGEEGWARTGRGVFWTDDAGRHWRRITPPVTHPDELRGADFGDPAHGWALAEEGREGATRPVFFSTADGGSSWRRAPVRIHGLLLSTADVSFAPVQGGLVFALVRQSGDTATNVGFLLASDDGGRSWRQVGRPPQAGRIAFESRRDGWLASDYPAPRLWRTRDGGRHWTEAAVPAPPIGEVDSTIFTTPRISADGHGLLGAVFVAKRVRETAAVVYATADFGRRWNAVLATPQPILDGSVDVTRFFAPIGPMTILFYDQVTARIARVGARGEEMRQSVRGIPDLARLSFSNQRDGFALSPFGRHHDLGFTSDGGATWVPVRDPR